MTRKVPTRRLRHKQNMPVRWSRLVGQSEGWVKVYSVGCQLTPPSLKQMAVMGGGGQSCGYVDNSALHIAQPLAPCSRNWQVQPPFHSATPPADRVPYRLGRPRPAYVHPTPSEVVLRCRTRSTVQSLAAPRSRPPARASRPPRTSASATAVR